MINKNQFFKEIENLVEDIPEKLKSFYEEIQIEVENSTQNNSSHDENPIVGYMIKDEYTGLYSSGGSNPAFKKNGKVWKRIEDLKNHLNIVKDRQRTETNFKNPYNLKRHINIVKVRDTEEMSVEEKERKGISLGF